MKGNVEWLTPDKILPSYLHKKKKKNTHEAKRESNIVVSKDVLLVNNLYRNKLHNVVVRTNEKLIKS